MSSEGEIFSPDVAKFVFAAERLMINVEQESLSEVDLKAIRYYLESLSDKFLRRPSSL